MISQEVQTLSCLLKNRTGLIGKFPENRPAKVVFSLEDGTPLRLLGFNSCHPSVINELGQKKVAGFSKGKSKKRVSLDEWRNLTESANAVLFTRKGRGYEVEVLERTASVSSDKTTLTVRFKKTGVNDEFVPCV